jgi:hypothetical protein
MTPSSYHVGHLTSELRIASSALVEKGVGENGNVEYGDDQAQPPLVPLSRLHVEWPELVPHLQQSSDLDLA